MSKKLKDFSQDKRNANKGTARGQKQITGSIQRNGFGRSMVADRNRVVVGGNKTIEASAEVFGVEVEPIIIESDGTRPIIHVRTDLDLDDPDPNNPARRLAYEDNLASYFSFELDPEIVSADMSLGFDFEAIDVSLLELGVMLEGAAGSLLGGDGAKDVEPQIDKAAELREKWSTASGQVWQLGEHRIVCGDCTDAAVVEGVMRGEKPGISFTDPPYNVGVAIGDATDDSQPKLKFFEWCKLWLRFMPEKKLLTVGVKNLLWWDGIIGPPQWVMAWVKRNGQGQTGLMGTNKWDPILVYGVEPDNNIDIIEINNDYSDHIKGEGIHPTSKPVELWVKILDRFGSRSEIVYEPFLGTGTTLLACENLKQKCRACEIESTYLAVTIQRWADLTGRDPIRLSE